MNLEQEALINFAQSCFKEAGYKMSIEQLEKQLSLKEEIINAMADCIAFGGKIYEGKPEKVKEYFEKKAEWNIENKE